VPAVQAKVIDVCADGFGHPQPVQGEQGHQRMLQRRTQAGGDEQGTEFVSVQGNSVRLVVHPWPADVRGRGMLQESFLHGVLAEPGDRAHTPGDGGARPAPGFEFCGEAFDVGAAEGEQGQGAGAVVNWRRSSP
jgi:hypothetical protein